MISPPDEKVLGERAAGVQHLLIFVLGQQAYALPLDVVVQLVGLVSTTPLPQVHSAVLGVANVHGALIPVIDLRRYFSLPDQGFTLETPLVLAHLAGNTVGFVVDAVREVATVPGSQQVSLEQVLPEELGATPVLQGVVLVAGALVPVLDVEQLFAPEQVARLEAALHAIRARLAAAEAVG